MTPLARLQRAAGWAAVGFGALGFATSVGCSPFPAGDPGWAPGLHLLLLGLGAACGAATAARGREIDRRRWQAVEDPLLTSGEREWAHKEAERERRMAGTALLSAPLLLGYWLAYQFGGGAGGRLDWAAVLPATPLAGFFLGWLAGRRRGD